MSEQATIKAEQLNATHLGEKIIILDNCEAVMSGKLKEFRATQYSMPVYSNDNRSRAQRLWEHQRCPETELRNCHRHHHAPVESA